MKLFWQKGNDIPNIYFGLLKIGGKNEMFIIETSFDNHSHYAALLAALDTLQ